MWSSFTKDEKKLFIFLLLLLGVGALVLPYFDERRRTDIFTAQSVADAKRTAERQESGRALRTQTGARGSQRNGPLDLNTATEAQLVALPGLGPVRAAAIVAYREQYGPFASLQDLGKVHGIGIATLRGLEGFVTVGRPNVGITTGVAEQNLRTFGFTPTPIAILPTKPQSVSFLPSPSPALASVLDLNSATVQELAELEQIGPILAQRIVDYRNQHGRFSSVEELDKVQGIGKKRIERNRHRLTVR
jgi:competence ComEA-like helix-hairpin-helix protein